MQTTSVYQLHLSIKQFATITSSHESNTYTSSNTLKRVTSGGIHRLGNTKTSKRCRVVGNTAYHLTVPGIEPQTSRTVSGVLNHYANRFINARNVCRNDEELSRHYAGSTTKPRKDFYRRRNRVKYNCQANIQTDAVAWIFRSTGLLWS